MTVSIIVPVLNEAAIIAAFLDHLREAVPAAEIIIVDGGSRDRTVELCGHKAEYVITAPRGRAPQMNAGAEIARGDVLWFVHADSRIAREAWPAIERVLSDGKVVGGCLRLQIVPSRWVYRMRDAIGNFCVDWIGVALGDRGLFCRREIFQRVGGYPEIAILEDAEFYRQLKRCGRVRQLREKIRTSARRYEALGPLATVCFYGFVMTLYVMRVPLPMLEKIVRAYGVKASGPPSVSVVATASRADQKIRPPHVPSAE